MKCPDHSYLSRFYDGELSEEDKRPVESHLLECERCSATLSKFQTIDRCIDDLHRPASLPENVARPSVLWRVATLAALIAMAFVVYPWQSDPGSPESSAKTYEFASQEAEYTVIVEGEAELLSLEMGEVKVIYEKD